jgi:hypothetical protein
MIGTTCGKVEQIRVWTFALLAAFVALGCATPYQENGMSGGYSDTQLAENMFRVTFRGNGHTSQERAADFALLRCGVLSKAHGFNYFIIIDERASTSESYYQTPSTSRVSATVTGNSVNGTVTTRGGHIYAISRPRSTNTIVCFKEKPEGVSYDAEFIVKSIGQKYGVFD